MSITTKINLALIAAIIASVALVIGDVFTLGYAADIEDYPAFSTAYIEQLGGMVPAALLAAPSERIMVGSLLIAFSTPCLSASMWLVSKTLRNSNKWYQTVLFWGLVTGAILTPLLHARFFFVSGILKAIANTDPSAHPILLKTTQDFMKVYYVGWGVALSVITVSWVAYAVLIVLGKTYLPKKAVFISPFGLIILLNLALNSLPSNVLTTTFGVATLSLAYLLFFLLFGVLYKKRLLVAMEAPDIS